MTEILTIYKVFLKDYSLSKEEIKKIEYCEENGYPQKDAIFDRIMFHDFCLMLRNTNRFNLWIELNDNMEKNVTEADDIFNTMCEMTMKKVQQLLKA